MTGILTRNPRPGISQNLFRAAAITIGLVCSIPTLVAQPAVQPQKSIQAFQYKTALKASQEAIDRTLTDFALTNEHGKAITLHELRGKPLVLSLIYTSCYHTCPMTIHYLSKVVEKARDTLGKDSFNVALMGFDARYDTPQAMKNFAKAQGVLDADWHLLSIAPEAAIKMTKELGFSYFSSPNGFDHITQVTIIDADSRIYRQVYGETFDTPLLVEPLMDLVLKRPRKDQTFLDDLTNRVRFFCTTYDPNSDSYHFDYSLFMGIFIGAFIILSGFAFIVMETLKNKRIAKLKTEG